ncbi:MAG TPA: DUF1559 domain-containing protein [Chthonomonas sp.]|uniref:DUF1559 family PulG-like putative transporter n=1 Tax=Chthonomonas sp. TaxID=2282153 RepID=UPI002B4B33ED|nr:DUF1559 domain-containing protein [Chthonomonas sp.]HLI47870.1 DUF1559 domain-containing protein [Chthonomonas sp.]
MRRCERTDRGFTLIELLVVIAIIALLAALLFPVFSRAREKARQSACLSNLHQIGLAVSMYLQDYDGYFPYAISPMEVYHNFWAEFSPSFAAQVPYLPQFHVVLQPYTKSHQVFDCPSDAGYDKYSLSACSPSDYCLLDRPAEAHPSSFIQWGTSYYYQTQLAEGNYSINSLDRSPAEALVAADGAGIWHGQMPAKDNWYDCLFADNHVKPVNATKVRAYQVSYIHKP